MNVPYPHKTVALCAGYILQCTCRLWWLGTWGDTAGNSLRCYYCRDWCLETQKHQKKYTKQIKDWLQTHKQMCFGIDKQTTRSKRQTFNETRTYFPPFQIFFLIFSKVMSPNKCCISSEKVDVYQPALHLSAQFHCRFSCASLGMCCSSGLSSCPRPSCHRFQSGQFLGLPTTASLLKDTTCTRMLNTLH